ncbi:acyltransferase family protein [Flammeovirga aprica]|uniref:Acyltransferase n=1 Tax=Flammeovirga aprica JL-4 TaxID=694437 RepID=A0A7X9XC62_9BACT|nr:acyltransferase [Flammeovirga aprica]NME71309.1 acyltransferase [Flammeovirga aprica JL-4]
MGKQKITSITSLRALAAFWIIIHHGDFCLFYRDLGSVIPREDSGLLTKGYLWIDFFFLLSGYVIHHNYGQQFIRGFNTKKAKLFIWNRFTRIYPLYLFMLCTLIAATKFFSYHYPWLIDDSWEAYFSYDLIPNHIFMLNAMNTHHALSWNLFSWSAGALWWTYVVAILFFGLMVRQKIVSVTITSLLLFLALFGLISYHPSHSLNITWDYGFIRCILEFMLGVNLYYLYFNRAGFKILSKDISFIISLLLVPLAFHFKINDLLLIPIFALLILTTSYNNGKVRDVFEHQLPKALGEMSYTLFLAHTFIFFLFWFTLPHWKAYLHIDEFLPIEYTTFYLSIITLSVMLSIPFHLYVEEISIEKLRKSIQSPKEEEQVEEPQQYNVRY